MLSFSQVDEPQHTFFVLRLSTISARDYVAEEHVSTMNRLFSKILKST